MNIMKKYFYSIMDSNPGTFGYPKLFRKALNHLGYMGTALAMQMFK
jgi:hypothetical protein